MNHKLFVCNQPYFSRFQEQKIILDATQKRKPAIARRGKCVAKADHPSSDAPSRQPLAPQKKGRKHRPLDHFGRSLALLDDGPQPLYQAIGHVPADKQKRKWRAGSLIFRASCSLLTEGFFDFLVGLVLAQGINRPNRCRNPSDESYLQDQANNAGNGPTNCEES
jgi:hypothetical protein